MEVPKYANPIKILVEVYELGPQTTDYRDESGFEVFDGRQSVTCQAYGRVLS